MTTGKIDYSPDYKSEKSELRHAVGLLFQNPHDLERVRLERAVVEAAREWPANYEREELLTDKLGLALFDAAQALIEFEAKQDQK